MSLWAASGYWKIAPELLALTLVRLAVDFEFASRTWWEAGGDDLWQGIAEDVLVVLFYVRTIMH